MRAFYESALWITQSFFSRNPDFHHGLLGRAIFDIGRCCCSSAVSTAEEVIADFNTVADHPALAMLADGSNGLDRTFEAVKGMPCACSDQIKTLVIVITANFAYCHTNLLLIAREIRGLIQTEIRALDMRDSTFHFAGRSLLEIILCNIQFLFG